MKPFNRALNRAMAVMFAVVFSIGLYPVPVTAAKKHPQILKIWDADNLADKVAAAKPGTTIVFKPGTYNLTRPLILKQPGVTLCSESGRRDTVILDGKMGEGPLMRENCINEIIAVRASDVTISGISICHARDHGIHISPGDRGNIRNVVMKNIRVYDCGQQLIKVNSNGGTPLYWVDDGILEDSLVEFTDTAIMQDKGRYFYTGGLDVHGGQNWIVRRNTFRNIQREGRLMEHAVHMWSKCRGTVVEQNRFIDCYRAVGFGMKTGPKGLVREYRDGKGDAPFADHVDGVIRNNFIFNHHRIHLESGIELMNVVDTRVYHNTVVSRDTPFSSIEYRWPNTRVEIINNIVSHTIKRRNNARAVLKNNIENAPMALFVNPAKGNLHLSSNALLAIDKGLPLEDAASLADIDGHRRDHRPDIGADERLGGGDEKK